MRTEVIRADSINAAAEQILDKLTDDTGTTHKENVFYFDGWDGLGASAVLRAIAQRVAMASEAPDGLQFDQIIHLDCSKWESERVLQRMIAEQLELPAEVMEMFHKQDEEDDFHGVGLESRTVIEQVLVVMHQRIVKLSHRFLLIFHNGSSKEINLASFGFNLFGYFASKVLWTFQGRFRLYPRMKVDDAMNKGPETTDGFLSASHRDQGPLELRSLLVSQEAVEVSLANAGDIDQVAKCFLYMWTLCGTVHQFRVDNDLATHICNYWVCDGIIHLQQKAEGVSTGYDDDESWRAARAIYRELRLDVDYYTYNQQNLPPQLERCAERIPYWSSPRIIKIAEKAVLSRDMFQNFGYLCVLKLSRCTLSFSSPPFLSCDNLTFLWLDHCQDQEIRSTDGAREEEGIRHRFFQKLRVLDVRYSCCKRILSAEMLDLMTRLRELNVIGAEDWDMSQLQGLLPNIRKIRIKNSTIKCGGSSSENGSLFSGMMKKIELLDFSGNKIVSDGVRSLIMTANNSSLLETVIIDEGCAGLEQISFSGCANLKNVLLRGLFEGLKSIDISGTSVKTLDLSAVEAKELDELVALGCGKLCAILWPSKENREKYLRKIRIGTTMEDSSNATSSSSLSVKYGAPEPMEYNWYGSVKDARLLRSLVPFEEYFDNLLVQMEISSASLAERGGSQEENRIIETSVSGGQLVPVNQEKRQQLVPVYADVTITFTDHVPQANDDGDDALTSSTQTWPCPPAPPLRPNNCYVHIQDQPVRRTRLPPRASRDITVPDMMCRSARILHVHDSKSIPYVPGPLEGSTWECLQWCRVERCPGLDCVFVCPQAASDKYLFYWLETLWCSQLRRVRCIWNFSGSSLTQRFHSRSFEDMVLVHVDLCPRLTHVLPLWADGLIDCSFQRSLETLEIVWCGDIRAVFPFDDAEVVHQRREDEDVQEEATTTVTFPFPSLKRVHLHELPKLLGICGRQRIYAPNLESIKVRGCWSLTRLPAVGNGDYNNKVNCDCEKEWWNNLKWDGKNHRSLYKPMHPRHNKKTLLRSSVLR